MYSESFITSSRGKKPLASSRTSNFKILFIRTKRSEESRLSRLAHARPPHSLLSLRRLPSAPLHAGVGFFPKTHTFCALSASRGSSDSKPDISAKLRCLLNKKQLSVYDSCPPPAGFALYSHASCMLAPGRLRRLPRTSCALSAPRGSSGSKPDVSAMHRRLLNKKVVPAMVRLSAPCRF